MNHTCCDAAWIVVKKMAAWRQAGKNPGLERLRRKHASTP